MRSDLRRHQLVPWGLGALAGVFLSACASARDPALPVSFTLASSRSLAILESDCLFVSVTGQGVAGSEVSDSSPGFGVTSAFFSASSGSVDVEVPVGSARTFRVHRLGGVSSCPVGEMPAQLLLSASAESRCRTDLTLQTLASTVQDVQGSQSISLTVSETAGTEPFSESAYCRRVLPPLVGSGGITPKLVAGANHTCYLNASGEVYCWGLNAQGQLGDGTTTSRGSVVRVSLPYPATQISSGSSHVCVTMERGAVRCWGANPDAGPALAPIGPSQLYRDPQVLPEVFNPDAIYLGNSFSCFTGGTPKRFSCFGFGTGGQLGDGAMTTSRQPRTVIFSSEPAVGYSSFSSSGGGAAYHACAIARPAVGGDEVYCWGNNGDFQAGSSVPALPGPNRVNMGGVSGNPVQVMTGTFHSCVLTDAGKVYCWGSHSSQQLGPGATTATHTPQSVVTQDASALFSGGGHNCVILTSTPPSLKCWGKNTSLQLGAGDSFSTTDQAIPREVKFLSGAVGAVEQPLHGAPGRTVVSLALGSSHTCALLSTGHIYCWGAPGAWNAFGDQGLGSCAGARAQARGDCPVVFP